MPYFAIAALIVLALGFLGDGSASKSVRIDTPPSDVSSYSSGYSSLDDIHTRREEKSIDRETAIEDHWDEIRGYANGSETVEACSNSGCYDLDADISGGEIEQINFPNGGYRYLNEEIDQNGDASAYDYEGDTNWDVSVDMNSSTIDDAVQEWADDNGYVIE